MTPFWSDAHLTLYGGDCRAVLAELPAESVHCAVTSPPYWGLRDYGVSDQLGLEPTPEAYVANMVAVFREVRRVLRADGTLWLNLGDSYAGARSEGGGTMAGFNDRYFGREWDGGKQAEVDTSKPARAAVAGLKPKDLVGIPWRVAFALQADGWYLRSDIIWSKPNPMPESVTDRPTKAHEYLFLLSKSPRYYFDADAVREPSEYGVTPGNGGSRNLRSVWTIATEPYPGAHFATFPRKLVEPCVKAGTSERGVCPECGAPWARDVAVESLPASGMGSQHKYEWHPRVGASGTLGANSNPTARTTTGWRPSCSCDAYSPEVGLPVPATVLDPFAGSGTTLFVAQALGRRGVGIDLNPDYLKQALARNAQTPLGLVG